MKLLVVAAILIGVAAATSVSAAPKKKEKGGDLTWTHPEFASFEVDRIALVPTVLYSNNLSAERVVDATIAASLAPIGYRWMSATTVREMLRSYAPNDSVLKAVRKAVLENVRADSVSAPYLCGRLRCSALLTVRVDQWEKREIEWNQSGKPSTSIQIKAALVDSTGALLWTVSTSETKEGPYHNAEANPIGMSGGSLQQTPVTGQGGAPGFDEVMFGIAKRWAGYFPAKSRAAAPDSTAATPGK